MHEPHLSGLVRITHFARNNVVMPQLKKTEVLQKVKVKV